MKHIFFLFFLFSNKLTFAKPYYEFTEKELKGKNIAIFGSFQCYINYFKPAMKYFKSQGANILAPIDSEIVDLKEDFIKFVKDEHINEKIKLKCNQLTGEEYTKCAEGFEKELQQAVFDKTRKYVDIVYVMNMDNCKIGLGTASEIGYVIALNDIRKKKIKIHCAQKPQSSHIRFFCEY